MPGAGSNAQSTAFAVQGLIAAGVDPSSLHRRGAPSPLDYLRSLIAADGHVRYARGTDETPTWVTAEALMALEGKPLPIAAPARRVAPARRRRPRRRRHRATARPARRTASQCACRRWRDRAVRRRSLGARGRPRPCVAWRVGPAGRATTADRLAIDAGVLTAVSLAFVGGS